MSTYQVAVLIDDVPGAIGHWVTKAGPSAQALCDWKKLYEISMDRPAAISDIYTHASATKIISLSPEDR
jgi:hypothetical protein